MSKKIKAFSIHLGLSILVACLVLVLVLLVWYPGPLAAATGVTSIILMLISFDVILGPLLTLLVYQEQKRTLKFDLSCIVVVQLLAFVYGIYTVAQTRPVLLVQTNQIFQMVSANSIVVQSQKRAPVEYQSNSWLKLKWVATNDQQALQQAILEPAFYPEYYIPLSQAESRIAQNANPLDDLKKFNLDQNVQQVLKNYPTATAWMPLRTTGLGLVVLLNEKNQVLATVDLRPWKE